MFESKNDIYNTLQKKVLPPEMKLNKIYKENLLYFINYNLIFIGINNKTEVRIIYYLY